MAWLSLFFPSTATYLAFFQNCYQGFVLANFFLLLQQCLGGRAGLVRLIGEKAPIKRGRFLWCLWERADRTFDKPYEVYLTYKRRSMQFVVVMPAIGLATVILYAVGKWNSDDWAPGNAFVWMSLIHIISVLTAMSSTNAFVSLMGDEIARLAPQARLRAKFWCVQSTVFLSFLQYFIISFVFFLADVQTTEYSAATVQQCTICIELAFASIAHVKYFSWTEFAEASVPASPEASQDVWRKREFTTGEAAKHSLMVSDVIDDIKVAFLEESTNRLPTDVRTPLLGAAATNTPPEPGAPGYIGGGVGPSRTPPTTGYPPNGYPPNYPAQPNQNTYYGATAAPPSGPAVPPTYPTS